MTGTMGNAARQCQGDESGLSIGTSPICLTTVPKSNFCSGSIFAIAMLALGSRISVVANCADYGFEFHSLSFFAAVPNGPSW